MIDQKLNVKPQPATATVQTDNPTPISLKGLWLQTIYIKQIDVNTNKSISSKEKLTIFICPC